MLVAVTKQIRPWRWAVQFASVTRPRSAVQIKRRVVIRHFDYTALYRVIWTPAFRSKRVPGCISIDVLYRCALDCQCASYWMQCALILWRRSIREHVTQGDMGGPLSCLINTRFQLAGIASYTADQCNPRRPQVYTSIPSYIDWIKLVTGIE